MPDFLRKTMEEHKRNGRVGLTSVCSANKLVVEAVLEHAKKRNLIGCIESTGHQVNQSGGYIGMQPQHFAEYVKRIAQLADLRNDQLILGGDHLGPEPWRSETSDAAMSKARELIRQCVRAGYRKLHLDASTPCRDDVCNGRPYLSVAMIAERTAALCESAEDAFDRDAGDGIRLAYVVGTDVPPPGGQHEDELDIPVSSENDLAETIRQMQRAFMERGLESAWNRCVALVAQNGATFGPEAVWGYDSRKTEDLKRFIQKDEKLVFEAHSTDFQTKEALADMVRDHFAILKVGPCLTFAMREAFFALAHMEREWIGSRRGATPSRLPEVLHDLMMTDRTHWQDQYRGDESTVRYLSAYGFSDRVRYYWANPRITEAVDMLIRNMTHHGIPLPLLSQYMPAQYEAVREGRLPCTPIRLVNSKIFEILDRYADACGHSICAAPTI